MWMLLKFFSGFVLILCLAVVAYAIFRRRPNQQAKTDTQSKN